MTTYDLDPTARLEGVHMVGVVRRRFLVSYAVEPSLLSAMVPPSAELSTHNGFAWVSACFVELVDMRPSIVPKGLGSRFYYLIHRTRARLLYPDGALRESVLVLEANMNEPLLALLGRVTTAVNFRVRDIDLVEGVDGWDLSMVDNGSVLYQSHIQRSSISESLPDCSIFENTSDADRFLLGVSYGGEWDKPKGRLRLLAETHDPWTAFAGASHTERFDFVEKLGASSLQADHVMTMTNIPHYFALRGFDVQCGSPDTNEA